MEVEAAKVYLQYQYLLIGREERDRLRHVELVKGESHVLLRDEGDLLMKCVYYASYNFYNYFFNQ